jgi:hypothetical protein
MEGLAIEDVDIFYGHFVYICILLPNGIFCGYLVYFFCFGMFYQEKSGNPGSKPLSLDFHIDSRYILQPFTLNNNYFKPLRAR